MQYDYTGMRVKKDAPTGMTLFPFKGYEIAPDGTITKFIRLGIETLASKKRTTSGATSQFFYHNDHLGGVNVITDGSGARCQLNEYDPWGGDSRSEGPTPGSPATCDPTHRFTGQELDPESGLYYYGGRYYDQEISRFISPDPYIQAPDDPQNLNRYSYVLNNPQGYVDPTGYEGENPGGYYPFWAWSAFFPQLFSSDPEPKYRIKPRKRGAATPQYEVEVKNGGPEDQRLKNVRVYESQPPPWSKDPDWATGNVGSDDPGSGSASEGPVQIACGHPACVFLNQLAQKAAPYVQRIERSLKEIATKVNNLKGHLTEKDLAAAREALANRHLYKSGGDVYQHLKEVQEAQAGLLNQIDRLQKMLSFPQLPAAHRAEAQRVLSEASKLLDISEEFVPR